MLLREGEAERDREGELCLLVLTEWKDFDRDLECLDFEALVLTI